MTQKHPFMALALAIGLAALSGYARAEDDCAPMRITSMDHVPVQDQADFGICYAAVASQMVDAWRFSHGDTQYDRHTSALAAALDTAASPDYDVPYPARIMGVDTRRRDITGGYSEQVLNQIRRYGACDSRLVALQDNNKNLFKVTEALKNIYKASGRLFPKGINEEIVYRLAGTTAFQPVFVDTVESCLKASGVEAWNLPWSKNLQSALAEQNPVVFTRAVLTARCEGLRQKPSIPKPKTFDGSGDTKPAQLRWLANTLLSFSNPQPVAFSFCSNVLANSGYQKYDLKKDFAQNKKDNFSQECAGHAALITGRRKNPASGKCEFLVRNSWGTQCGYDAIKAWDCQNGELWVDQEDLMRTTWRLTYFE